VKLEEGQTHPGIPILEDCQGREYCPRCFSEAELSLENVAKWARQVQMSHGLFA